MLHVESTFFCANTCPTDNAPICARQYLLPSNQQTFSNICQLQVYNYNNWANRTHINLNSEKFKMLHKSFFVTEFYQVASGACPTGAVTCSTTCDTTYAPVTGYELGNIFAIRSFNNPCELINYNCAPTGRAVVQTAPIIPCPTYAF